MFLKDLNIMLKMINNVSTIYIQMCLINHVVHQNGYIKYLLHAAKSTRSLK